MAKEMVKQMGLQDPERATHIQKITEQLYLRNIEPMKRLAEKKIKATNPEAEYCSMTAMMFGLIPIQELDG